MNLFVLDYNDPRRFELDTPALFADGRWGDAAGGQVADAVRDERRPDGARRRDAAHKSTLCTED